jgi:hypothetical protein
LLENARKNSTRIKLHAGTMPWPFACVGLHKSGELGLKQALRLAKARQYIPTDEKCKGNDKHYELFTKTISGKDDATEEYRDSYAANMLRAASTATRVN